MNRLDRRLVILRGKRKGTFNTDQYYLERARRGAAARKVRFALRRNRPVVLVTPRWTNEHQFLDDVSTDLALGEPAVQARTLDLSGLNGRPKHHSWTWIVEALTELCSLQGAYSGPAWQAVDSRGFRHVLTDLLMKSRNGPYRCMLLFGLQYLNLECRDDLIRVFETHMDIAGDQRRMNFVFASAVDASHFDVQRGLRLHVPDFSEPEAMEALVEQVGPRAKRSLTSAARLVGGVPALVQAIGRDGSMVDTNDKVWRAIGPLAEEIRSAMNIVNSDERLARRLETIAREGSVVYQPSRDDALLSAGLIRRGTHGTPTRVEVRAPVIEDLALHG